MRHAYKQRCLALVMYISLFHNRRMEALLTFICMRNVCKQCYLAFKGIGGGKRGVKGRGWRLNDIGTEKMSRVRTMLFSGARV